MKYLDYLEKEMGKFPDTPDNYKFKKEMIAVMSARANEIVASGIKDDKVLNDLVISEFADISERYNEYINKKKTAAKSKSVAKIGSLATVLYVALVTCVYLVYSFATSQWGKSWLIMVGGMFGLLIIIMALAAKKTTGKQGGNSVARISVIISVFLIATFAFLVLTVIKHISNAYIMFIVAAAASLIADGAFAWISKSKTAIFNIMLYIPAVGALFYVIAGLTGLLSWHPGWMIIVFALLIDVVIFFTRTLKSSGKSGEA